MIKLNINVSKIEKERLFQGKNGKYLDCVLIDRPDDHGNAGFIVQDVTKEEREAGERGPIIGNFKILGGAKKNQPASRPPAKRPPDDDPDF